MKYFGVFFAFVMLSLLAHAQTKSVTGTVVDEDSNPLPGATVSVVGTQTATMTDMDGKFTISVSGGDKTLSISFLGMETQKVTIVPNMTVKLLYGATQLEEVVSLGYYQKKEGALTGSVGLIKENALKQPVANMTQMLQGVTAGVFAVSQSGKPGEGASIQIRGLTSINSGTSPLYIVDGIPVSESDFALINPNDIQNVNVLKDASATALYGSRGSNGVILVQTKRGMDEETIVTYKGEYGFSSLSRGNLKMMNTQEKLAYEIKAGLYDPNSEYGQSLVAERSKYDLDQFDEVFRTPQTQSHELAIRGGNKRTKFYLSAGYFSQAGIIPSSNFNRMTGNINLDHQAKSWLKVGTNLFLVQSKNSSPVTPDLSSGYGSNLQNPVNLAIRLNPYERLRDDDGNYVPFLTTYNTYNPLREAELVNYDDKVYSLRNLTYIEIEAIKNLKFRSSIGFTLKDNINSQSASPKSFWGSSTNGYATKSNNLDYSIIQNNQLTYSKKFDKHNMTVIGGSETLKEKNSSFEVIAQNIQYPSFTQLSQYMNIYPSGWGGGYSEHSMVSGYGIINYDFDNRYFVDLSFRSDGDSRLAEGNRWRQFWSAGFQWNLKTESFLENVNAISNAKLRFSLGTQGNSNIGNYAARKTYAGGSYNGKPASTPYNYGNPDLTWEKTTAYDLGADISLFNHRVRATLDLYQRNTTNLFFNVPVSSTSGYTSRLQNAGKMTNKGIELMVGTDIIREKDFYLGIEANLTLNKNRVVELYEYTDEIISGDKPSIIKEGYAYGQIYAVRWAGVNPVNGDPLWYDKEGNVTNKYSEASAVILEGKNYLPNKTAGLTLNASYKGLSLQAMFSAIWDKWILNNNLYFFETDAGAYAQQYNHTTNAIDFWTKPGDVTEFPRIGSNSSGVFDSRLIQNQSFLRLKNITLSYSLNKKALKSLKVVKGTRIYATAQNLWTLSDYRGLDPEISGAVDLGKYPASKTFTFGVELSF